MNSTVNTVQTDNITIESEDDLYSDIVHTHNSDFGIHTESNITKIKGYKRKNQKTRTRYNNKK